jgi:hypothetical protein
MAMFASRKTKDIGDEMNLAIVLMGRARLRKAKTRRCEKLRNFLGDVHARLAGQSH